MVIGSNPHDYCRFVCVRVCVCMCVHVCICVCVCMHAHGVEEIGDQVWLQSTLICQKVL